jgi:hypothetical protein
MVSAQRISRLSSTLGYAASTIGGLEKAGEALGLSSEEVDTGLLKLTKTWVFRKPSG